MFSYRKKDFKELAEQRKEAQIKIEEQREKLQETILKAQRCLNSPIFTDYLKSIKELEEKTIDLLRSYPVNDPGYSVVCCKYLSELNVIGSLLKMVERDAHAKR